jgi:hypothetical protein
MMRVKIMGKQTVSDAVPDNDLEQVEFHVGPLTLTITGNDGLRETLGLRIFVPASVQGTAHFIKDTICGLKAMLEQTALLLSLTILRATISITIWLSTPLTLSQHHH